MKHKNNNNVIYASKMAALHMFLSIAAAVLFDPSSLAKATVLSVFEYVRR